jgi:hypothetical protein
MIENALVFFLSYPKCFFIKILLAHLVMINAASASDNLLLDESTFIISTTLSFFYSIVKPSNFVFLLVFFLDKTLANKFLEMSSTLEVAYEVLLSLTFDIRFY